MQTLPPFRSIASYLEIKDKAHNNELQGWRETSKILSATFSELIIEVDSKINQNLSSLAEREKKYEEEITALRVKLRDLEGRITKLKRLIPAPRKPEFSPLPDIMHVPTLNPADRMYVRGKTKRKLKAVMMDDILQRIRSGQQDGIVIDFMDLWPDPPQEEIIANAIRARNDIISDNRLKEENFRCEVESRYIDELTVWEREEAQRKEQLGECRRSARVINISIDANIKRMTRIQSELNEIQSHRRSLDEVAKHQKECEREFALVRTKHSLERRRLLHAITKLKSRLIYILAARKSALQMPNNSRNPIEYENVTKKAEGMLHMLRFELVCFNELNNQLNYHVGEL